MSSNPVIMLECHSVAAPSLPTGREWSAPACNFGGAACISLSQPKNPFQARSGSPAASTLADPASRSNGARGPVAAGVSFTHYHSELQITSLPGRIPMESLRKASMSYAV